MLEGQPRSLLAPVPLEDGHADRQRGNAAARSRSPAAHEAARARSPGAAAGAPTRSQQAMDDLVKANLVVVRRYRILDRGRDPDRHPVPQRQRAARSRMPSASSSASPTCWRRSRTRSASRATRTTGPIKTVAFYSNWELSAARAGSVVRVLSNAASTPSRLAVIGYGEQRPVQTNDTAEGRNANRRVVVVILSTRSSRPAIAAPSPPIRQAQAADSGDAIRPRHGRLSPAHPAAHPVIQPRGACAIDTAAAGPAVSSRPRRTATATAACAATAHRNSLRMPTVAPAVERRHWHGTCTLNGDAAPLRAGNPTVGAATSTRSVNPFTEGYRAMTLPSLEILLIAGRAVFLLFSFIIAAITFTAWRRATQAADRTGASQQTSRSCSGSPRSRRAWMRRRSAVTQLGERLDRPRHGRPGHRAVTSPGYQMAIRLARSGASREELMSGCGLSLGEAELVQRLHGHIPRRCVTNSVTRHGPLALTRNCVNFP